MLTFLGGHFLMFASVKESVVSFYNAESIKQCGYSETSTQWKIPAVRNFYVFTTAGPSGVYRHIKQKYADEVIRSLSSEDLNGLYAKVGCQFRIRTAVAN